MKRPSAASSAGPASKRAAKQDPNVSKLEAICAAVTDAEGYPERVLKMVAAGAEGSLMTPQDERHEFQNDVADMIGEVLASVVKHRAIGVEAVAAKIEASDSERAARECAVEAATQVAADRLQAVESAKGVLSEAATAVGHANAAVSEATSEQKSGDAAYLNAASKKAQLEAVLAGDFEALKTGAAESVKKATKAVIKTGKDFDLESQLLTSAESALLKPAGSRGGFEAMVLEQLEDQLKSRLAAFDAQLATGEAGKEERAAKKEAAEADLKAAGEKHAAQLASLEAAQAAHREAEAQKKAAAKSLEDLGPELEALATKLEEASSAQSVAVEVQGFHAALKARTSVAEAEPEPSAAAEKAASGEAVAAS